MEVAIRLSRVGAVLVSLIEWRGVGEHSGPVTARQPFSVRHTTQVTASFTSMTVKMPSPRNVMTAPRRRKERLAQRHRRQDDRRAGMESWCVSKLLYCAVRPVAQG